MANEDVDVAALGARMVQLQKRARRLAATSLAATAIACVGAVLGAAGPSLARTRVPNIIEAHEFAVIDTAGRTRAELATQGGDGIASLQLKDGQGNLRASLGAPPSSDVEPFLVFAQPDGTPIWRAP